MSRARIEPLTSRVNSTLGAAPGTGSPALAGVGDSPTAIAASNPQTPAASLLLVIRLLIVLVIIAGSYGEIGPTPKRP
ncbi:hypothetical protein GCM10010341_79110 [Streptomyces noursei]|nr:hypothetical protein GCM10010341_79110 [Streptomyces noursei]